MAKNPKSLKAFGKRKQGKLIKQLPEVFKEVWLENMDALIKATLLRPSEKKESDSLRNIGEASEERFINENKSKCTRWNEVGIRTIHYRRHSHC